MELLYWIIRDKPCNYRVFISKGPTQKSSKYGIGPTQQDKMAKYTGPTQSYQREFSDYSDAVQWYSNIITQSFHYLFGYKTP